MAKLDINSASLDELKNVNGIGERRAQAIVNHREEKGGLRSLDDLRLLPYFDDLTITDREGLEAQLEVRSYTTEVKQGGGKSRQ